MKTREELLEYAKQFGKQYAVDNVMDLDSEFFGYLFDHISADVQEGNPFFVATNGDYISSTMVSQRKQRVFKPYLDEIGFRPAIRATAFKGRLDDGHTCPDWNDILRLGVAGLRQRAQDLAAAPGKTPEQIRFYQNVVKAYDGGMRYLLRAAEAADAAGKKEMAEGLRNLTVRAPENLFEAIQTLMIFYRFQHTVEATLLRTFGRLDQSLYPFYMKEQDRAAAKKMLRDLIAAFDVFDQEAANMPFAIGGLDADGNCAVNELSYELLAAYQEVPCSNVKLHLMCSENTPEDFIKMALDGIRNGKNSVVFLSDETVIKSLTFLGASEVDARNYAVLGCYECAAYGEVACTDAGRVSMPLALEAALFGGKHLKSGATIGLTDEMPMDTFEDLFAAFEAQLRYFCQKSMQIIDFHEQNAAKMKSTPFYSSTFASVMEQGADIYHHHTAKYNNTSVLAVGLATCADSLLAIKKMVYEEKKVTLDQLKEILRNNWEGAEVLRLTAKNRYPKFGQANGEADEMAARLIRLLSDEINNKPNTKGGVYRLGSFSITYRWAMGEATAATADGRFAGETLSLNTGASFGAAKFGATAHLISVAGLDNELMSDGSIVDIDLHSSAVAGENGLNAMYAALRTYFELGGFAVHYNVLDLQTLKEAREDPTRHPDLQVRLCGWNTLFSSLSDKEKDEYIARAQEG